MKTHESLTRMNTGRRYSQEIKTKILTLYQEGAPFTELVTEFGINKSTLYIWIKSSGISFHKHLKLPRKPKPPNPISSNERRRAHDRVSKKKILNHYGVSCTLCGFDDPRALQIDHINNDGHLEPKKKNGRRVTGTTFYRRLIREGYPSNYQTLCANCNLIKYSDYKETLKSL